MNIKQLKVYGERDFSVRSFTREHMIYPERTKRDVLAFYFLYKTLGGVRKIGFQRVRQSATLDIDSNQDGTIAYNRWKDECFLDRPSFFARQSNSRAVTS